MYIKTIRLFLIFLCAIQHFVSNASENCVDVSSKNDAYWSSLFAQTETALETVYIFNAAQIPLFVAVYEVHEALNVKGLFGYIYQIPAHQMLAIPVPKLAKTEKLFFSDALNKFNVKDSSGQSFALYDTKNLLIKKIMLYPTKDGKPDNEGTDIKAAPLDLKVYVKVTGIIDPILIENQTPYDLFVALYQESGKDAKKAEQTQKIDAGGFVLIERPERKFGTDRNVYFSSDEQKLKEQLPPDDRLRVKKQFINVGSGILGTNEFKISSIVIDTTVQGPETASKKVKPAVVCKTLQKVEQPIEKPTVKPEKIITETTTSVQVTNNDNNFALQVWLREKKDDKYCLIGKSKTIKPKETIDLKYSFESKNETRLYFRAVEKNQKLKIDQCQETCERELQACHQPAQDCQEEYKECKKLEGNEGYIVLDKENEDQKIVIYRVNEKGQADPYCSLYDRKHKAVSYAEFYESPLIGENKIKKEMEESFEKFRANKGSCP